MLDFGFSKNRLSDGVKGPLLKYGIRYCLCILVLNLNPTC